MLFCRTLATPEDFADWAMRAAVQAHSSGPWDERYAADFYEAAGTFYSCVKESTLHTLRAQWVSNCLSLSLSL